MGSRIPENLQLLGLIVTTRPFSYEDNIVKSSVELYAELSDLQQLKQQLDTELQMVASTDESLRRELNDDLYFLNKIIQTLEVN